MVQTRLFGEIEGDGEAGSNGAVSQAAHSRSPEVGAFSEKDPQGFFKRCLEVGKQVLEMESPLVVHHYDADGLSSGAIVCRALRTAGKSFSRRVAKRLDDKTLGEIAAEGRPVVFTDFGSGYYGAIVGKISDFAVIDHHQPDKGEESGESQKGKRPPAAPNEANCELFGFSGSLDLSAAGTAYFCFRDRDENGALAQLGIVGAVGDMMDLAAGGLSGLNRVVLEDALEKRSAMIQTDLRIFGRVSRPLVNFLSYCTEPFLPGLTGDEKACAAFLQENNFPIWREVDAGGLGHLGGSGSVDAAAGIQGAASDAGAAGKRKWVRYYDLDFDERRRFASCLVDYVLEKGVGEGAASAMIGEVYLFPTQDETCELYDAYEYSTLLNACGRHGQEEKGISVCLGEEGALEAARSTLQLHRTLIRQGIFAARKSASDFGAFYFLDGRATRPKISDTVIGTIAGEFLASGLVSRNKPIIAFALDENGRVKASGRGTKELVEKGLDLDEAMRVATDGIGFGGGHKIAAGASISEEGKEGEFLMRCKEVLKRQLGP